MNERNTTFATWYACALTLVMTASMNSVHAIEWIDLRAAAPIAGDATSGQAKATVCVACHGNNGNATVPEFPSLAGQHADYLYWQLVNYKRGAQPQSSMTGQAERLSDTDMRDLAAYFAAQTPKPPSLAPAPSSDRGEVLFREGDPSHGSPPCQGCHGADAAGVADPRFATWPNLRGQHAAYVITRLKEYRAGTLARSSNDFVMQGVARTLDDDAIDAIAAWIASLPPQVAR